MKAGTRESEPSRRPRHKWLRYSGTGGRRVAEDRNRRRPVFATLVPAFRTD